MKYNISRRKKEKIMLYDAYGYRVPYKKKKLKGGI